MRASERAAIQQAIVDLKRDGDAAVFRVVEALNTLLDTPPDPDGEISVSLTREEAEALFHGANQDNLDAYNRAEYKLAERLEIENVAVGRRCSGCGRVQPVERFSDYCQACIWSEHRASTRRYDANLRRLDAMLDEDGLPDPERDIERVAEWLYRYDRRKTARATEPVEPTAANERRLRNAAADLLALLDREQGRCPTCGETDPDRDLDLENGPCYDRFHGWQNVEVSAADREQGEARGDDGVGCSCGWPLDPCNPTYLQTASLCDKERYEREVIPAPADREGRFDRCIHDECPHGCTAYCRDRGGADREGEQDGD